MRDLPRSREDLRRPVVIQSRELQSMGRLAAAWLAIDIEATHESFDQAIALARFEALTAQRALDLPDRRGLARADMTREHVATRVSIAAAHDVPRGTRTAQA